MKDKKQLLIGIVSVLVVVGTLVTYRLLKFPKKAEAPISSQTTVTSEVSPGTVVEPQPLPSQYPSQMLKSGGVEQSMKLSNQLKATPEMLSGQRPQQVKVPTQEEMIADQKAITRMQQDQKNFMQLPEKTRLERTHENQAYLLKHLPKDHVMRMHPILRFSNNNELSSQTTQLQLLQLRNDVEQALNRKK